MKRQIKVDGTSTGHEEHVPADGDLRTWLEEYARTYDLRWLLVHADNGIIWGAMRAEGLKLSSDVFGPPQLRLERTTLQQARLFGPTGELRLWQGPHGLNAYLRRDGLGDEERVWFDETYLLWGTRRERSREQFSELVEGAQGIRHSVPFEFTPNDQQRAKLLVRHYVGEDASGVARVVDSRLVDISA